MQQMQLILRPINQSSNMNANPSLAVGCSPIYHSYYTHYKEMECFRYHYEDLFYEYGVDFVLNGHVHAVSQGALGQHL
jgi:hypothetical protein